MPSIAKEVGMAVVDPRQPVLEGLEKPTSEKIESFLTTLGDQVKGLTAVVSAFGVLLYVVLWVSYAVFYNRFHLSPRDFGFGYLDLLLQSAFGIILLLVAMFAVAAVVALFASSKISTPVRIVVLGTAVAAWGIFLLGSVLHVLGVAESRVLSFGIWAILLAVTTPGIYTALKGKLQSDDPRKKARWRLATLAVTFSMLLGASGTLLLEAYHDRSRVWDGRTASFKVMGFPVTGWGAQRASFEWTSGSTSPEASTLGGRCLLYFGQSGGTAYFFRADTNEVLRIATGTIVVHTGASACARK
jgi:uncharacterized membrane protein